MSRAFSARSRFRTLRASPGLRRASATRPRLKFPRNAVPTRLRNDRTAVQPTMDACVNQLPSAMPPQKQQLDADLLARFAVLVGARNAITAPAEIAPYVSEERGLYHGHSPLVLRPGSTEEVAAVLKLANQTRTPIVPQGGNTGLVGGQTPLGREIVLSLKRLDRLRELDVTSSTMTCEAGVILARAQGAPAAARRLFPLSLRARGRCTIGGHLFPHAGRTR